MGADVVVVGGGVIGLAVAWTVARDHPAEQVTVVDSHPGSGASHVAAGMLAPVTEALWGEESLLALNLASARAWPAFAAELEEATGIDVGYLTCGTLAVALDQGDRAELEELHRFQLELGLESTWLSAREARELEPLLAPSIRGALLAGGDHQVDNRKLLSALCAACERSGVKFVHEDVAAVESGARYRTAVRLVGGELIEGSWVVVAAGCRSAQLVDGIPVRPLKGQILRLAAPVDPPLMSRNVRGIVNGKSCYLVPRSSGEVVVGATVEEQGFDTTVTAGAVYELLRDAQRIVPVVAELALAESSAGLRPATPDNLPLVGECGLAGLIAATGHGRNGILLTPITVDIVSAIVGGQPQIAAAVVCAPARFGEMAGRR